MNIIGQMHGILFVAFFVNVQDCFIIVFFVSINIYMHMSVCQS